MIKHFHSICWLGHLNSISTKKEETKIFQATTMMLLDILFISHLVRLIIYHFAVNEQMRTQKLGGKLVSRGLRFSQLKDHVACVLWWFSVFPN